MRQGPRLSIRVALWTFPSETLFVNRVTEMLSLLLTAASLSYFLTNFSTGYRENNPRFGFLDKFYVDGYVIEIFFDCFFMDARELQARAGQFAMRF